MTPEAEHFLSGIYNPVNRSNLITSLAAGVVMQVDKLPVDLLPTVVLLAVIGVRRYNQQIVDDYVLLLRRMVDTINKADVTRTIQETGERYNHPQLHMVSALVFGFLEEERDALWIEEFPESRYMTRVYEELLNIDLTELFSEGGICKTGRQKRRIDSR